MSLIKNNTYDCEITDYTNEGMGVCKIDGNVVFVNNAVKGDFVNIKIVKTTKNISYGIILKIIDNSKNRIEPECPVSQKCGGCSLWHMSYDEELEFKREKVENVIKRIGKIDFNVAQCIGSSDISRYRNKAQYPVCDENGQAIFGFFRKNSHDVVRINDCLIQTKTSNEIAKFIVDFMNLHKIPAYNENKNRGFVRHIYIRTGFMTGEIQVCIVTRDLNIPKIEILKQDLLENFPEIHSLMLNKNNKVTNVILGDNYKLLYGNSEIEDVLCDNKFKISPEAFYQVNRKSAENLYKKAIEFAEFQGDEIVLDMYCGVGTITLAVSNHVKKVTGIEIVPEAINNARKNAKLNQILNADFIVGDAKIAVKTFEKEKIDVIIVDPPRKGLDLDTIQSIIKINPEKICYISCDPATMARDIKIFSENGYMLSKTTAFDLFPRTFHVETVCLLSKV